MVRWARQLLEQGGRGEGRRAKGGDWRGLEKTSLEKLLRSQLDSGKLKVVEGLLFPAKTNTFKFCELTF